MLQSQGLTPLAIYCPFRPWALVKLSTALTLTQRPPFPPPALLVAPNLARPRQPMLSVDPSRIRSLLPQNQMTQTLLTSIGNAAPRQRGERGKALLSGKTVGIGGVCRLGKPCANLSGPAGGAPADRPASYAVKMLRPCWQNDPEAIRLLQREALVGQSVSHPHLVPVLSASRARAAAAAGHALAGRGVACRPAWPPASSSTCRSPLDRPADGRGPRRPARGGLDARRRDAGQHPRLADRARHAVGPELRPPPRRRSARPSTGRSWARASYLAPEYLTSALRPDIRSDIYSLGAVLFEMLSGRVPFCGRGSGGIGRAAPAGRAARSWPGWRRTCRAKWFDWSAG